MIKHLWRWHPKVSLRYLPIVKRIQDNNLDSKPVLEIGSGSLGITPYLGKRITGLDVDFEGPQTDLLTKVYGSALKIPFEDNSFETVLIVDVLEHIVSDKRAKAIEEAVRIAKTLLIIAVPEGPESEKEDWELSKYYKSIYHKEFPFYKEHLLYGLPREKNVMATINDACKKYQKKARIEVEGNVSLELHNFLMKGWMTNSMVVDLLFRKIMLVLVPIFSTMNREPTYRKVFYVTFKK